MKDFDFRQIGKDTYQKEMFLREQRNISLLTIYEEHGDEMQQEILSNLPFRKLANLKEK